MKIDVTTDGEGIYLMANDGLYFLSTDGNIKKITE